MTGELSTVVGCALPQAWAVALLGAGFEGLVARGRHDPSLTARAFAVFGPGGTSSRRTGWRISRVPYSVPTIAPPEPTGRPGSGPSP